MRKNVGTFDRVLRVAAGLALTALAATHVIGPWGWIGLVPLLTGLAGSCPLYSLIGASTCSSEKR